MFALVTNPLEYIVEPERNNGLKPIVEVNPLNYKQIEDLQPQIKRYMKFELKGAKGKTHACTQEVKNESEFDAYRNKLVGMMT